MQMKYLNMQMRYLICVYTTIEYMDNTLHVDNTGVHCYPRTKFRQGKPYSQSSGYLPFLILANQNKYANGIFIMRIQWWQTQWVLFVPTTTHIPSFVTVAHIELWIFAFCFVFFCFLFVISQSEQIYKWDIKYSNLLTTNHMDNIRAYHYQHTKFRHCSPYRT